MIFRDEFPYLTDVKKHEEQYRTQYNEKKKSGREKIVITQHIAEVIQQSDATQNEGNDKLRSTSGKCCKYPLHTQSFRNKKHPADVFTCPVGHP